MSKWEEYYCTIIIQSNPFECKYLLHQIDISKRSLLCYIDGTIIRRTLYIHKTKGKQITTGGGAAGGGGGGDRRDKYHKNVYSTDYTVTSNFLSPPPPPPPPPPPSFSLPLSVCLSVYLSMSFSIFIFHIVFYSFICL